MLAPLGVASTSSDVHDATPSTGLRSSHSTQYIQLTNCDKVITHIETRLTQVVSNHYNESMGLEKNLIIGISAYSVILSISQLLMKKGLALVHSESKGWEWGRLLLQRELILGLLLQCSCVLLWIFLLRIHKLSLMFPLAAGMSFALITIGSNVWLGERPTARGLIGMVLILGGIILLQEVNL